MPHTPQVPPPIRPPTTKIKRTKRSTKRPPPSQVQIPVSQTPTLNTHQQPSNAFVRPPTVSPHTMQGASAGTTSSKSIFHDVMAPGVGILVAMIPKNDEPGSIPIGKKPSLFGIMSGTSMACPHVTGAAAFIKSVHEMWIPSMIKSALMTIGIVFSS
ncbi:hypothetical protein AHAS_Ahas20G0117800 [Arachis hypogaea]